jgi:hypothetical protein
MEHVSVMGHNASYTWETPRKNQTKSKQHILMLVSVQESS